MKFYLKLLFYFAILKIVSGSTTEVEKAFKEFDLVPYEIPKAPKGLVNVIYNKNIKVDLGNRITPLQALIKPQVLPEEPLEDDCFYTLVLVDPDVPSRQAPLLKFFQHWTVVNIPGFDVDSGETLAEYVPPTPPPGSGPHRYVFLVYKQSQRQTFAEDRLTVSNVIRAGFNLTDFVKRNNLGHPILGNFFLSEISLPLNL